MIMTQQEWQSTRKFLAGDDLAEARLQWGYETDPNYTVAYEYHGRFVIWFDSERAQWWTLMYNDDCESFDLRVVEEWLWSQAHDEINDYATVDAQCG
jgi:hypothetical protein